MDFRTYLTCAMGKNALKSLDFGAATDKTVKMLKKIGRRCIFQNGFLAEACVFSMYVYNSRNLDRRNKHKQTLCITRSETSRGV